MGLVAAFRARLSSHGAGRLIIYVPKGLQPRLRPLHERRSRLIVLLAEEG